MSNIQRSQSAPHLVRGAAHTSFLLSPNAYDDGARRAQRQKVVRPPYHHATAPPATSSTVATPLQSPLVEREDPFGASLFFPSVAREEQEASWRWIRKEQDDGHDGRSLYSVPESDDGPATPSEGEDLAAEVITREDKLGVLSLHVNGIFRGTEPSDDRLMTPYTEDEPICDEALYDALRSRRRRSLPLSKLATETKMGSLFDPVEDKEQEGDVVDRMYEHFRRLVGA